MAAGGDLDLVAELLAIARALGEGSIPYAVCGGVAVTIHGAVRSTKDIDLLVRREDREAVLWVVSREGLIEMKRIAGRLQDLADIEKLEAPDEEA